MIPKTSIVGNKGALKGNPSYVSTCNESTDDCHYISQIRIKSHVISWRNDLMVWLEEWWGHHHKSGGTYTSKLSVEEQVEELESKLDGMSIGSEEMNWAAKVGELALTSG